MDKLNLSAQRVNEVAKNMLQRYSTPKVAYEMALLHAEDSVTPDIWRAVAKRIKVIEALKE
jgi:hypothetical protein